MSYKITVDLENAGKGTVVEIDGLGQFSNGSTDTVTDDQAEAYRRKHSFAEINEDGVAEIKLGPTLLQAFKNHPGVKVEKVSDPEPDPVVAEEKGAAKDEGGKN